TDYTGTITFSSSDGSATLPGDYTFVLGDAGTHTFTNGVTLETTADQYVRVNDGAAQGEQANITANPAALGSCTVAGVNDPHVAGVAQSPVVTAYDIFGNVKTDYTGTITFSSSDGSATLPADYSFVLGDSGVHTFTNGVTF